MALNLTSDEFEDGDRIPDRHTCTGDDFSPSFSWDGDPEATQGFVLLCENPDAPDAPDGTLRHWAIFDIPLSTKWLGAGLGRQAQFGPMRQSVNDFGTMGYSGPCPPEGRGIHHYHFRLFALSVPKLEILINPSCSDVEEAAKSHILEKAVLTGTYSRG